MQIYLRIPKGWSKPVPNQSKETCDLDGAKLWIGPGNQIYCDQETQLGRSRIASEDCGKIRNYQILDFDDGLHTWYVGANRPSRFTFTA